MNMCAAKSGTPDCTIAGATMTAAMMYDAVTGTASPRSQKAIAEYATVRNSCPPARDTMMPAIFSPSPVIVGVVTLTGLGLKMAGIIVSLAGGQLFLTVAYSAIAFWLLGLAVPVTASYIIAAVMVAPAMVQSGVPDFAAHMFIFYYAVLSEVSPPTALSPFAAAALTGASPFETMMLTWKYTLPAFLVPFVFTLSPEGAGALLRGPLGTIALTCLTAAIGVGALAAGLGGWVRVRASLPERVGLSIGGLFL